MNGIVLFVEKDYQHIIKAADLDDNGTKSFGDMVLVNTEKKGDVNKLVKGRIIAAYCDGKVAYKKGIKALSGGHVWMPIDSFKGYCEKLVVRGGE